MLTQEITDWVKDQILTSTDPVVQKAFSGKNYKVTDYFFNEDSLRLRSAGYRLLRTVFDSEEFKHDRPFYTGEILILSKNMNAPFYISEEKIVLFHHEHIVMCKLAGSVTLWLNNFS